MLSCIMSARPTPRLSTILLALALVALPSSLRAQGHDDALTAKEVEQLRDSAYFPDQRVLVYIGFLDDRTRLLNDLFAKPRKPGREDDAHDLLQQFDSIADELEDNIIDAKEHHQDLRKVLPKLISATERWATDLRSPADDPRYSLTRKLALDAVRDLRDDANDIIAEQKTWFAAHPQPKKQDDNQTPQPYTIPDPR